METQLEKSEAFALNFASMLAIQTALKQLNQDSQIPLVQLENTILEAVEAHPTPAEA